MGLIHQRIVFIDWCVTNIGPQKYYIPSNTGTKVGGPGWEITTWRSGSVFVYIMDRQLDLMFRLKFAEALTA